MGSTISGTTVFGPFALVLLCVLAFLIVILPRRFAVVPLLAAICFVPSSQRIVIFGADLTVVRMICLCGWMRVWLRRTEMPARGRLDRAMLLYAAACLVTYPLRTLSPLAVITVSGRLIDAAGVYFLTRCLLPDSGGIGRFGSVFQFFLMLLGAAFVFELTFRFNPFASIYYHVFPYPWLRERWFRCSGPFAHPILAGVFGAVSAALLGAAARPATPAAKARFLLAAASCGVMVAASASSTAIIALLSGAAAAPARRFGKLAAPLALLSPMIVLLLLLSGAISILPRIEALNVFHASTGTHRATLLVESLRHISDWFLIGTPSTARWGFGMADVTNQFVLEAVSGGILRLAAFGWVLLAAFLEARSRIRSAGAGSFESDRMWAFCTMLVMSVILFNGVSYFGQNVAFFYLTLALLQSAVVPGDDARRSPVRAVSEKTGS